MAEWLSFKKNLPLLMCFLWTYSIVKFHNYVRNMNLFIYLKTMQAVNKKMDPQKTLQTMQNFQKENMKMEMTEEMSKCNHL